MARVLTRLVARLALPSVALAAGADLHPSHDGILYDLTEAEFHSMPALFELDEYEGCLAVGGTYCLGSFNLTPLDPASSLFRLMQDYSADWVDHYNHTRLHRGVCISRRCPHPHPAAAEPHPADWFASCVNGSMREFGLSATLSQLEYCRAGASGHHAGPPAAGGRGLAAVLAALLALTVLSTALDLTMTDHAKKERRWVTLWSVRESWRALCDGGVPLVPTDKPPASEERALRDSAYPSCFPGNVPDMRVLDGLRVLCMLCVIVDHVVWLGTQSYVASPRYCELARRWGDVALLTNSTLMVQAFFVLSGFLLAKKLLARPPPLDSIGIFARTMVTRIVRVSPSYFVVLWFAASWWEYLGSGPLWEPLVGGETRVCRKKWWTHLLYLNNVMYPDDKCLIQTWYLAADLQLYACCAALTLLLRRRPGAALPALSALFLAACAALAAVAHSYRLLPTFTMHTPEHVRASYAGERTFNLLYQSALGNAPAALAGLLLAHLLHAAPPQRLPLRDYKWFCWCSAWATPAATAWLAVSPHLLGRGPPSPAAAAALAALERPLLSLLVVLALLGAMHGVESPWTSVLSWRGWRVPARLSFGALLLHMPLNKTLVASRHTPLQLDRMYTVVTWFGVALGAYLLALPLALLVELPTQRVCNYVSHVKRRTPDTGPESRPLQRDDSKR